MRYSILLSLTTVGLVAATGSNNGCNANNCLRQVIKEGSEAPRLADCTSYLSATVTPDPTTTTKTWTKYTFPSKPHHGGGHGGHHKRDVTEFPTAVPTYASACLDFPTEYSSACLCAGALPSTTTLPQATITEHAKKTEEAKPFILKLDDGDRKDWNDRYVVTDKHTGLLELGSKDDATRFAIVGHDDVLITSGGPVHPVDGDSHITTKQLNGIWAVLNNCSKSGGKLKCEHGSKKKWSIDYNTHSDKDDEVLISYSGSTSFYVVPVNW
ncbi:hypothetical protein TWF696_007583 [Orbilia brochopaga]|uniref:Uncharacterized protein n=1 Tax=Orbilia brochopaga TaxID=3140254 RepID=A0AAV9UP16_9PEZI